VIPFNRPDVGATELSVVTEALGLGKLSGGGPIAGAVEEHLTELHGCGRTLLTTSCTHALEMAAHLIDATFGDEVILPSYTFVSTASAFMMRGLKPIFVDVRPDTLCIDVQQVERALTSKTRAVCAVHYGGVSADLDELSDLCTDRNLTLVEDNAHGLFGKYKGSDLGTFGSTSTLSFHETKNIVCGEGGALQINDLALVERAEILREKGTDRAKFFRGQVDKYVWREVGSSWVLSEILAAMLKAQLSRKEELQANRLAVWTAYHNGLQEWSDKFGIRQPTVPPHCEHPAHLYYLIFKSLEERSDFISHMAAAGVMAVFHYQSLHLSPVGRAIGGVEGQCPVSEQASDCLVRLPLFSGLSNSEVDSVLEAATSFRAR